jgi:hypothetical protein
VFPLFPDCNSYIVILCICLTDAVGEREATKTEFVGKGAWELILFHIISICNKTESSLQIKHQGKLFLCKFSSQYLRSNHTNVLQTNYRKGWYFFHKIEKS